jgi:phytol kinase
MTEALRAAAVGAAFLGIFAAAELWRRYGDPPAEWSRKFVHFAGGLVVLAFPWIFTSRWTVAALVAVFVTLIWGTRRLGWLQSVHGVARKTEGGLFYPLAVAALFTLSHDRPVLYLISMLTLVGSDAAAAVLGSAYGRTTYAVEEGRRSLEGSAAFFLATFLAVHLPLLLMTPVDRGVSVLLAVQVALLVTLFEGVSLWGSDNLLIPLSTYYLLLRFTPAAAGEIATHILVLVALLLFLGVLGQRARLLRTSGVMATALFFYAVYFLAGATWMAAPALALLGLTALRYVRGGRRPSLPEADYQVLATFYAVVVGVALLVAHDVAPRLAGDAEWLRLGEAFRAPFVGAIAGQLAIVAATQIRPFDSDRREPPSLPLTLALLAGSLALVVPPALWLTGGLGASPMATAAAIAAAAALIYRWARLLPGWPTAPPWNLRLQTVSLLLATALVLPVHLWLLASGR